MKYVYLVGLFALLQIATCEEPVNVESEDTEDPITDPSLNGTTLTSETEPSVTENGDNSSTEVMVNNGTDPTPTESTTGGQEVDIGPYTQAADDTTTSAKEEPSTTGPKPVHGLATLVHPSVLAIVAPVCIRLFSTKLAVAV